MNTQSRKIKIKSILKNPLAEKLEIKHQNSILNLAKVKKSFKSHN
jgi:hypothetical protein